MKTTFRRALATVLSVLLLMAAVPLSVWPTVTVSAASTATFADGTAYEYTVNSGTATITKYIGTATVVDIPESLDGSTVTTIGNDAFRDTEITAVTIPDMVTRIENYAFAYCYALSDVTLPKALTYLGRRAFANAAIESIEIPKSLDSCDKYSSYSYTFEGKTYSVYDGPFFCCENLKSATFEEGATQIAQNLFAGAVALESVAIPDTVTVIEDSAFRDCLRLADVTIGQAVTTIDDYAFNSCVALQTLVLPDSVTRIDAFAFESCRNLQSVTLSKALTQLGRRAFSHTAIESIAIPKLLDSCDKYSSYSYEFEGKTYYIHDGPFFCCENLKSATFEEGATQVAQNLFAGAVALESVVIPDTVTVIENSAFRDCLRLTDVIIGQAVTTISDYAFNSCYSLRSVVLPNMVTRINAYAFESCRNLQSVTLSKSLTDLGRRAFAYTAIESIEIPKSLDICDKYSDYSYEFEGKSYYVYDGPFFCCENLKSVTFEKGTTQIAQNLFAGAVALESVVIPDTVTVIEDSAFRSCLRLADVTIGQAVTEIKGYAFDRCVSLSEVTISQAVKKIGDYAFSSCISLQSVVMPDRVTKIGNYAFDSCSNLQSVTLSKSLVELGRRAFAYTAIESIEIPKSLDICSKYSDYSYEFDGVYYYVYDGPFFCCENLKSVTFAEGTTQIAQNLFAGAVALESVVIPDTVTVIEDSAFRSCLRLREVTLPDSLVEIASYAFSGCRSLTSVVIPDTVTNMGTYCFEYCSSLESARLPNQRVNITSHTFFQCTSLKTIDIPATVENIREYAFYGCSALESVTFSNGSRLKTIEPYAFSYCSALREAVLPDTVTTVNDRAFANNAGLIKVVIPQSTKTLGEQVFMGCESLADVQIADYSLTEIPARTFMDCSALMRIELPKGLTTVKSEAFRNTVELCEIVVPESVTSIASNAISYPFRTTIYGTVGSYAEAFSETDDYTFVNYRVATQGIALKGGLDTVVIDQGETYRAEFEVFPEDANEVITLTSNTGNVTIQGHDLYGRYACDAVITATASGGMSCQFNLHVRSVKNIRVITLPNKTAYYLGEVFDPTGMVVQVNYNDGSSRIVTDYSILNYSSDTEGTCTVKVRWISANNGTYDHTFDVTVFDPNPKLTGIYVHTLPLKQYYNMREALDVTGLVVKGLYTDGVERTVEDYTLSGFNALQAGDQMITVAVGEFTDTFMVSVGASRTLTEIALAQTPTKTTYYIGDTLSTADLWLELIYDDGFTSMASSGFTVSGYDASLAGEQTITVTYGEFAVTYTVRVLTPAVTLSYTQHTMKVGEQFALLAGSNPGGQTVSWTSSDNQIAVVENGLIRAVAEGTVTITATITYNGRSYSNTCAVSVCAVEAELVDVTITALPQKSVYAYGEELDTTGLVLHLTYNDDTVVEMTDGFIVQGYNAQVSGYQMVTVSYGGFSDTFAVTVQPPVLDENSPAFVVSSTMASRGGTVDVTLSTKNNSGIVSLKVWVEYDSSVLELVSMKGQDFENVLFGPVGACPVAIDWLDTLSPNDTTNGVVAVLTFKVKGNAAQGDTAITVHYNAEDVYDYDFHNVPFAVENGTVTVADYISGDVNGDGLVNNKDVGLLMRYLGGWEVTIDELASDVDRSNQLNMRDLALLQRYLNGWDVELL